MQLYHWQQDLVLDVLIIVPFCIVEMDWLRLQKFAIPWQDREDALEQLSLRVKRVQDVLPPAVCSIVEMES